jgi:RNA polymerase sigma factor (sigma-70 family)
MTPVLAAHVEASFAGQVRAADSMAPDRIGRALAKLPPEQAAILQLTFLDGLSHSEIAWQTGLCLGSVKARLRLALTRLRRSI